MPPPPTDRSPDTPPAEGSSPLSEPQSHAEVLPPSPERLDDLAVMESAPQASSESTTAAISPEPMTTPRSPTLVKKTQADTSSSTAASQPSRKSSTESRKRKRPSVADHSESEQPPEKRTDSIGAANRGSSTDDVAMADDEATSTNPQSGNHTAEEEDDAGVKAESKEELPGVASEEVPAPSKSKKGKRSPTKKRKSKSPPEAGAQEEAPDEPSEDAEMANLEVPTPQAEDAPAEEVDEEAEAAQQNEEELEKKKAAWEELVAIEKQFSSFRERLYQERLEQLNQEEAMLTGDNPTHPEYLAMLRCLEERRAESIRRSGLELQFKLSVLRHRAVAERAQIMSQFYQAVRESREQALEELGQEWYEIQQERRRAANTIPDYGIRFPATRAQAVRDAVSYNKEVSVLSGFAKHVGFPAAPQLHGASEEQLEADLEAIQSAREPIPRHVPNQIPPFRPDYAAGITFGQGLGVAGEQFIEQTPWANPNHPSHHIQRQQAHREANLHATYVGPSPAPRRHANQSGGLFSSSTTTISNGDSPVQVQKTLSPVVPEKPVKGPKMAPELLRREPAIHAS